LRNITTIYHRKHLPRTRYEKGFSLLEVLIAVLVLGILAVGFLPALASSTTHAISVDEKETAKNIAEDQMEYVKTLDYVQTPGTYASNISTDYSSRGFSVPAISTASVPGRDSEIQRVVVTVCKNGSPVLSLEGYKLK
jgi:prepilin-type N-terminal cleavage/methylation domain-containing protein